jgi:nucleoside-diphosphate-sugar epimerase
LLAANVASRDEVGGTLPYHDLERRKVVIIGATGFIGSHLASALARHGADVVCVSRNIRGRHLPSGRNMTWKECDASIIEDVRRLFEEVQPEIVYHLTSDSKGGREIAIVPDSVRNDVIAGTNVLVEATRIGKVRVVLAGSFEEPSRDDDFPCSPYAAAKSTITSYGRMISALGGLEVSILRLMMTYGPRQKSNKVLPYVINRLKAGQIAEVGSGSRMLDWVYVDDVVDAFLRVGSLPWTGSEPIDIGTGSLMRLRDSIETIGKLMGRSDLLRFGAINDRVLEREETADVETALQKLGWRASTSFRNGIRATIDSIIAAILCVIPLLIFQCGSDA